MKTQKYSALFVLASAVLLMGCTDQAKGGMARARLLADPASPFEVTTNLAETKEIHTARQKEYLAYEGEYVSIPEANYPDGQQHLSEPNPVNLAWNFSGSKTVSRYDVKVGQKADLSDGYVIKGTSAASLNVYNSFLGDNYFQIIANYADGTKDESAIQMYKVDEVYPRNLKIDGMTNCRDMGGGRTLEDGGKIKQGLIYRTSATTSWGNGRAVVPDSITNDGKEVLFNQLGVKTEINVNNGGDSHLSEVQNYVSAKMYYDGGKHHLYRNGEPIKEVFHALADENNYPVFYHCRIGTDRTGLCAILISGLLGVSENEIYQDYLFSNFGNIQEKRYIGDKAGRDNILNYINDLKAFPGEKFQNKVYNYLLSIGVPASELDSTINILTEGTKAQGNDNSQEAILAEAFEAEGAEMKTETSQKHPKKYYTLGENQSVIAEFNPNYNGEAKLVAYLGSSSSASFKINDSISATLDGNDVEISDEVTSTSAGFGQGDGRTYYSAVVLGTVNIVHGSTEVVITGKANNLNIGAISIIPMEKVTPADNKPNNNSKGCGGSIVATTSLIALVAAAGASILVFRKRKQD